MPWEALRRFVQRPYDPSSREAEVRVKSGDPITPSEGFPLAELAKRSSVAKAIAELVFERPPATTEPPHASGPDDGTADVKRPGTESRTP